MATCEERDKPPRSIGSAILKDEEPGRTVILVTPRGDERLYRGAVRHTFSFIDAVARLSDGVTLRLLPGKYYRAVQLVRKRGTAEKPIVIEGCMDDGRPLSHICGTNAAGSIYPKLPDWGDYAFIKLRECEHVVIQGFRVESCWPCFVYAERSTAVTVRNVTGQDGTYLVFLRGPDARGLAVTDCRWEQDPTGALWSMIDWEQSHHGAYAYYNGALAGGVDVHGDIEVARNVVRNAYNGIRFATSTDRREAILGRFNVNARIHDNAFINIRDNAVEPEHTLLNWHIYRNTVRNAHAPFSIHDFHGGYLYIYANRLWFDDRGGADYQDNRGGKIYKLRRKGPLPDHPVHIFHNSIYSRTFLIKEARSRHLIHRNNAVQFCAPDDHPACMCQGDRSFLSEFPVDGDLQPLPWDATVLFDGDASSQCFSPALLAAGQESCGVVEADLGFADPRSGDFAPRAGSPLLEAGLTFTLESGRDLPEGQPSWSNWPHPGRPNIGAVQATGEIECPFVPMPMPPVA
jgi:hypothetical protein